MQLKRLFIAVLAVTAVLFSNVSTLYAQTTVINRAPSDTVLGLGFSPQQGQAIQSIPIQVPPGVNNIQPNIVLQYHAQSKPGLLGVGWSLELGAIERSTKNGVPKYTAEDTFQLLMSGGRQDLIYDENVGFYRTEIEGAFYKINKIGESFEVIDGSGTIMTFGGTDDAQLYNEEEGVTSTIFRYALNQIEDIHGNKLKIHYVRHENQLYPDYIEYNFDASGNNPLTKVTFEKTLRTNSHQSYKPAFRIKTDYYISKIKTEVGTKTQKEYHLTHTPSPGTNRDLLTAVSVLGDDGVTALPAKTFSYFNDKGFAVDPSANIPSEVQFSAPTTGVQEYRDLGVRIIDINGDAYPDILKNYVEVNGSNYNHINKAFINNKNLSWSENPNYQLPGVCDESLESCITFVHELETTSQGKVYPDFSTSIADVDGDGLNDVVVHQRNLKITITYPGPGNINYDTGFDDRSYIAFNNLDSQFGSSTPFGVAPDDTQFMFWGEVDDGGNKSYRLETMGNVLADVNGDGFADIITSRRATEQNDINTAIESYKRVYLNDRSGHFSEVPSFTRVDNGYTDFAQGGTLVDLNGDGLVDILYRNIINGVTQDHVFMNHGTRWIEDSTSPWKNVSVGNTTDGSTKFTDINGDGLADMVIATGGVSS
ncbi:MAG: VCBS repeat-containing protein, partial [Candidatus Omnitrophica bacterium]|nr:VCBS repeat-containing protein [Candidatus Omnitrophota bacterium]